jgi:N-acetylmuramoyl-L-alanine amidase
MRRLCALLLMICILLVGAPMSVSADEPKITAEVDERRMELYTVNLTLDNLFLASDVPPVLFEYQQQFRTLVPVAAIASYAGAEVSWDGDTREVTIIKDETAIVLTIDSASVMVNGEEKTLPSRVPAKIVTYQERGRTMVPVAFVGQELGMKVDWDESSRTVRLTSPEPEAIEPEEPAEEPDEKDEENGANNPSASDILLKGIRITMDGDTPEIRLQTDTKITYSTTYLTAPTRLVFDIQNAWLMLSDQQKNQINSNGQLEVKASNNPYLTSARMSQFSKDPHAVRLVLDLKQNIGHKVTYDERTGETVIRPTNYVDDVRFEHFNTREMIVIEGNNISNYNIMHLDNPKRLVVDIKDSVLNPNRLFVDRNIGGRVVNRIRTSEFKPDHHYDPDDIISRVVIDLNKAVSNNDLYIIEENGQLLVHLEGKPEDGYRYEGIGWTASQLTFYGNARTDYKLVEESAGNLIKVTMPATNMNIPFDLLEVNDPMVEFIQVSEGSNGELVTHIKMKPGSILQYGNLNNVQDLVLTFTNTDIKYREKLIVIDAGHGGSDPGAISGTMKMLEKDINLKVALETQRMLEAAGFRTYMIRTNDTYVALQDRAGAANMLNADLFVSIHANSAANKNMKGVETLYYPSENNPADFRNNKYLATIFQDEMVRALGAASFRINARDKLVVLRETKMPAIITELGFLSNAEEEKLLATSDYQRRAAQGATNAVIRYFEETLTHLASRP